MAGACTLPNLFSAILRLRDRPLMAPWHVSVCSMLNCPHIFLLKWMLIKTMSRKFHRLSTKSFRDSVKNRYFLNSIKVTETFSWVQTIKMFKNVFFSIFLMILQEHVHMGWNFQGTSKSSISFNGSIFSCIWHI